MRKYIDADAGNMLKNGIAQVSFSSWALPCLLVSKSDNSFCFFSDFTKANSLTKLDSYPLPCIDDCINLLGTAKLIKSFLSTERLLGGSFKQQYKLNCSFQHPRLLINCFKLHLPASHFIFMVLS